MSEIAQEARNRRWRRRVDTGHTRTGGRRAYFLILHFGNACFSSGRLSPVIFV